MIFWNEVFISLDDYWCDIWDHSVNHQIIELIIRKVEKLQIVLLTNLKNRWLLHQQHVAFINSDFTNFKIHYGVQNTCTISKRRCDITFTVDRKIHCSVIVSCSSDLLNNTNSKYSRTDNRSFKRQWSTSGSILCNLITVDCWM